MAETPERRDDELTLDEKARILRNIKLGAPPPDNESDAARKYRERMEDEVDEYRDMGIEIEPIWDP